MKYYQQILAVFCLVALTGCDPTLKSSDVATDAASLQKNAIVVTRVHAPYKSSFTGETTDIPVRSFWRRLDGATGENRTRYMLGRDGLFGGLDTNGFHEHMLAPGKYKLEELVYTTMAGRTTTIHTLMAEPFIDINFEVKPGDIVYLGDIQLKTSTKTAKVVDYHEAAERWFKENHPEISKPLEKRILKDPDPKQSLMYRVLLEGIKKVAADEAKKK